MKKEILALLRQAKKDLLDKGTKHINDKNIETLNDAISDYYKVDAAVLIIANLHND